MGVVCKLVPADSCDDQDDLASSLVMRLFELIEERKTWLSTC